MKRTDKTKYLSPECEVVECRLQGVLAASPDASMDFGFDNTYDEGIDW